MKKLALTIATLLCANLANSAPVENFGANLAPLQQAFANKKLHILQIGDSHTAGDYFTDQLRKRLQADIGDGGIGFAYPIDLKAQRTARHGYQTQTGDFSTYNSKSQKHGDYTLGGVSVMPNYANARLTLSSQFYQGDRQVAKIMVKGNIGQKVVINDIIGARTLPLSENGWQVLETNVNFPVQLQLDNNMAIGGYWLDRGEGGRVSAMGINGATQSYWQRWQHADFGLRQSQADLVILAYGTNEAFSADISEHTSHVNDAIAKIRQSLPNATILIINAPESLKSTQGSCGTRATHLDQVQANLRQIAQNNGTLYWSWQEAMGSECSMKSWIEQGLGAKDGVHFSKLGYQTAGDDLYNNLRPLLINTSIKPVQNTNHLEPAYRPTLPHRQPVSIKCDNTGKCLLSNR